MRGLSGETSEVGDRAGKVKRSLDVTLIGRLISSKEAGVGKLTTRGMATRGRLTVLVMEGEIRENERRELVVAIALGEEEETRSIRDEIRRTCEIIVPISSAEGLNLE